MSGGRFNYEDTVLGNTIFGYKVTPDYGMNSEQVMKDSMLARKLNPFQDAEISELIFDVFCLLKSFDYSESGDIGEEDYASDVRFFKDKWFGKNKEERVKSEIDKSVNQLKQDLYKEFGVVEP